MVFISGKLNAFFLRSGASQGRPVLPLLHNMVLEVLATTIKEKDAGSQHVRSHQWQAHEEKTWQQGKSGPQGFRKAAPALTLKMISVFLMLAVLDYSLISVTRVDGLPRSLSKQNQLRTLVNMSPRWWYPIRLSRMKGVFQFRPLCWHSSLLGKCVLMHMTAHSTLIMNSIKNLITQKALIGTEPFRGWGSPIREHKNLF